MSVFGVCSKFVAQSGNDARFLFDVLYAFLQDNELRIALDSDGKILDHYSRAAVESDDLKRWIIHLGRNPALCLEPIAIDTRELDHDELFVEVSRRIVPNPCLVVWSLQHYDKWADDELEIIDRMQAARRIKKIAAGAVRRNKRKAEKASIINRGVIKMAGDRYSANQVGAMGPNAQATGNTLVQAKGDVNVDARTLVPELAQLRAAMRKEASEPEHDIAVAEVAKAESAAKNGDSGGALAHLKAAGKWAADVATKIGTTIAAKAIESAMGMQ